MKSLTYKPSQRGFSLVELMVAMVLSMVTMLGILSAYKAVVTNTQASVKKAKVDSAGAALSVSFSRMIQSAGWGVGASLKTPGGAADSDVVVLKGATFANGRLSGTVEPITTAPAPGNALVWSSAVSGVNVCRGVAVEKGAIVRFGPVNCSNAAQWNSLAWGAPQYLALEDTFPKATITAHKTKCWPFGGGPGPQPAVIAAINDAGTMSASVCLNNIPN